MKAVLCTRPGGPRDLEFRDLPDPQAGPEEAVVAIKAVALNFFDLLIVAGKYQVKPAFPFSPGAEFAGVVESVGAAVADVAPGERVIGHVPFGAARQRLAVPAHRLCKLPAGLDFARAAGLTVTYGTTYHALKDRGGLRSGETLAVLGAAGGTGLSAVEIGRLMGARVIACASSDDKLAFARQHGADEGVNYATQDLKDALRQLTGGRGVDVVYDPVGGDYAVAALRAMDWGGRFLVIGFTAGSIPQFPANIILLKSYDVVGVHWGAWIDRDPAGHRANMRQILDWCLEAKLSAHVHAVYPLARIADALEDIATRKAMGKIILKP